MIYDKLVNLHNSEGGSSEGVKTFIDAYYDGDDDEGEEEGEEKESADGEKLDGEPTEGDLTEENWIDDDFE